MKTPELSKAQYMAIVDEVMDLYNTFAGNEEFPQRSFAGCIIRFAGHDFLDFRTHEDGSVTGGSDGCIKLDEPDNKGLVSCTNAIGLEAVYANWCDVVSLADFLVIAADAVMGRTATEHDERERFAEGSLIDRFMQVFKFGRETAETCPGEGLMPDAETGC